MSHEAVLSADYAPPASRAAVAASAPPAPPVPEPTRPAAPARLQILDGLRLVAALMVVVFHLVSNPGRIWGAPPQEVFGPLNTVFGYGWLGVELFFLISGFVICMSAWGRSLGEFFVSRVVRLYPAYWFAVLATTAVVTMWPLITQRLPLREIAANLTMLNGLLGLRNVDNSYWSLTVELVFYLLFAIVVARGVDYRRVVIFSAVWTVAAVLASASGNDWLKLLFQPEYSPYFIAGMAMFLMHRFGPHLLLWAIIGMSWLLAVEGMAEPAHQRGVSYPVVIAMITGFFLVMIAISLGKLSWIRAPWLVTAGALTYPLYLIHQLIGLTVIAALRDVVPAWALFGGLILALLLAAWLIHRIVEKPVARWLKRQLTSSLRQVRSASDPVPLRP